MKTGPFLHMQTQTIYVNSYHNMITNIKSNSAPTFIIFPKAKYRVFNKFLNPFDALIILNNLATLIILRAVKLKATENNESSNEIKEVITMMKSNRFQFSWK